MRPLPTVLIAIALIFNSCETQKKPEGPIIVPKDKEILTRFKKVYWPKAYREQDTILLDQMLGEDFQMIDNSGIWYDKAYELNWLRENAMENDSFWYEIKRMDILPNGTAIICGTGHIVNDSVESIYQSSNVIVKRYGVWKAVASHVSGFKTINEDAKQ